MAMRCSGDDDKMDITASSSKNTEAEKQTRDGRNYKCKYPLPLESVEDYKQCKMSIIMTLKYHKPAPGLVELEEHTGVYVNANILAVCKRISNDLLAMARMLVTEIFTTIALSTCSVTNTGVRAVDYHERRVKNATKILLEFVTEREWFDSNITCNIMTRNNGILKGIDLKMKDMLRARQRELDEERLKDKLTIYNKNDSRWTLKHREPAQRLVELIQDSGVYINADNLNDYKRLSKKFSTLVPLLLHEIFTMCALTACSVTDARKRYNLSKLNSMRLDEHAIETIVKFSEEYGEEQGWKLEKNCSIRQYVCCYLSEIRGTWEFWFWSK